MCLRPEPAGELTTLPETHYSWFGKGIEWVEFYVPLDT